MKPESPEASISASVRAVVAWLEARPQSQINERACVDCGTVADQMVVYGLPGSSCRDYRRCLRCAEIAGAI